MKLIKNHTESDKRKRESSWLKPPPLPEGGCYKVRDSLWEVRDSSHSLDAPALWSKIRKTSPLAHLKAVWLSRGLQETEIPLVKSTDTHLLSPSHSTEEAVESAQCPNWLARTPQHAPPSKYWVSTPILCSSAAPREVEAAAAKRG